MFEKVVSPLIELLLHETSEYDNRDKNKPQFKVTLEELKNFIGLIFLSGYNIRLAERDYWGVDPDLRCDTFCETMNGSRFFEVKLFLHAADNQSLSKSRMVKVEPLCDLMNKNIQQFRTAHDDLSIGESMVLYYGCHSCKQFIRAKPIRFGYKLWVLVSATGVPYKIEIFQGRTNQGSDETLGIRVVKNGLEFCKNPKVHRVFFDNFFSSYSLICDLAIMGFSATATMRNYRTMNCPLVDVKKNKRGSFDFRSDGNIEIVRWIDNSVVTIGSNAYGVQPIGSAKRWIKGKEEIKYSATRRYCCI